MQPFIVLGDHVVQPFTANGIPGEIVSVRTDRGRRVHAWRPNMALYVNPGGGHVNPQGAYFCHGFSLGTFSFRTAPNAGYSVMSGQSMVVVLADEYWKLGNVRGPGPLPMGPQARDLIVWWRGQDPIHSALIAQPAVDRAGRLDISSTLVSSKTGTGIVRISVPLAVVNADYPTASLIELYRRVV